MGWDAYHNGAFCLVGSHSGHISEFFLKKKTSNENSWLVH